MKFLEGFIRIDELLNRSQSFAKMTLCVEKLSDSFAETAESVERLASSVRDLTKACAALARMIQEDRHNIAELYQLHAQLISEVHSTNVQPTAEDRTKLNMRPTPIENIVNEKKKKLTN